MMKISDLFFKLLVASAFLMVLFVTVTDNSASFEESLRDERCTNWGESVPPEYEGYCKW